MRGIKENQLREGGQQMQFSGKLGAIMRTLGSRSDSKKEKIVTLWETSSGDKEQALTGIGLSKTGASWLGALDICNKKGEKI